MKYNLKKIKTFATTLRSENIKKYKTFFISYSLHFFLNSQWGCFPSVCQRSSPFHTLALQLRLSQRERLGGNLASLLGLLRRRSTTLAALLGTTEPSSWLCKEGKPSIWLCSHKKKEGKTKLSRWLGNARQREIPPCSSRFPTANRRKAPLTPKNRSFSCSAKKLNYFFDNFQINVPGGVPFFFPMAYWAAQQGFLLRSQEAQQRLCFVYEVAQEAQQGLCFLEQPNQRKAAFLCLALQRSKGRLCNAKRPSLTSLARGCNSLSLPKGLLRSASKSSATITPKQSVKKFYNVLKKDTRLPFLFFRKRQHCSKSTFLPLKNFITDIEPIFIITPFPESKYSFLKQSKNFKNRILMICTKYIQTINDQKQKIQSIWFFEKFSNQKWKSDSYVFSLADVLCCCSAIPLQAKEVAVGFALGLRTKKPLALLRLFQEPKGDKISSQGVGFAKQRNSSLRLNSQKKAEQGLRYLLNYLLSISQRHNDNLKKSHNLTRFNFNQYYIMKNLIKKNKNVPSSVLLIYLNFHLRFLNFFVWEIKAFVLLCLGSTSVEKAYWVRHEAQQGLCFATQEAQQGLCFATQEAKPEIFPSGYFVDKAANPREKTHSSLFSLQLQSQDKARRRLFSKNSLKLVLWQSTKKNHNKNSLYSIFKKYWLKVLKINLIIKTKVKNQTKILNKSRQKSNNFTELLPFFPWLCLQSSPGFVRLCFATQEAQQGNEPLALQHHRWSFLLANPTTGFGCSKKRSKGSCFAAKKRSKGTQRSHKPFLPLALQPSLMLQSQGRKGTTKLQSQGEEGTNTYALLTETIGFSFPYLSCSAFLSTFGFWQRELESASNYYYYKTKHRGLEGNKQLGYGDVNSIDKYKWVKSSKNPYFVGLHSSKVLNKIYINQQILETFLIYQSLKTHITHLFFFKNLVTELPKNKVTDFTWLQSKKYYMLLLTCLPVANVLSCSATKGSLESNSSQKLENSKKSIKQTIKNNFKDKSIENGIYLYTYYLMP